jgi:hypothetical protein
MKFKPSILEETIKAAYNPDAYATQLNKGLEQVVEGGKMSMKLAAQQNAFFLNAMTKALSGSLMPNPFGFNLGGQALEGYAAIQKNMLDVAMEQGTAVIEAIQESGKKVEKANSEFSNMVQQSLSAAQKEITKLAVNPLDSSEVKA